MAAALGAFLAVSAVMIVTPGPDTALTIRNTLMGGRRAGCFSAIGVSAGQALWTLATATGIAALLAASEPAFLAVKVAGSAYLIWLGLQALIAAASGRPRHAATVERRRLAAPRALRQGLLNNLGNPKMAAFFPSLLLQFGHSFSALLALGLVFSAMTLVWLVAYAFAVARAGDFLGRSRMRRAIEAATGAILVALGLRVATESR
jgi:threonine/homoserine/homoserine lactone efflux protein